MATKTTSNLFSNFDDTGTEANAEIIKNSMNVSKTSKSIKVKQTKELINDINHNIVKTPKSVNTKLETLAGKLAKDKIDKKSYMTIYLKKSIQIKIDGMAKKLGVSNGSVIELLINEFE